MSMNEQQLGPASFTWTITRAPDATTVVFRGEVDENVDFAALPRELDGRVIFHLQDVNRINSCGVREWINFVRELSGVTDLVFSHCSTTVVNQLNMIYNFRGDATVRSFYLPYVCESCDHEDERLVEVASELPNGYRGSIPEHECSRCHAKMVIDEIPERYLSFLSDE
jgi:hypothetical protein